MDENKTINLSRRNFLKVSAVAGAGATFTFNLSSCSSTSSNLTSQNEKLYTNAWVHIPENGSITFTCPRSEMGQGISTGLAALICEGLDYPIDQIEVLNAPVDRAYAHKQYRLQTTGGSSSIPTEWEAMLEIGASIRATIISAAAKKWNTDTNKITTKDGQVIYQDKVMSYQSLSKEVANETIVKVIPKINFKKTKYIGKTIPRVDNYAKVTGKEQYGIDGGIKNSLSAVIIPFPEFGSTPLSCNEAELMKMKGVQHVLKISTGFAIVAQKQWQALAAKDAFEGKWSKPTQLFQSSEYTKHCKKLTSNYEGKELLDEGKNFKTSEITIEEEYSVPYLAHAPLEPQNANVWIKEDSAQVWMSTQAPGMIKPIISDITGINHDKIEVTSASLGGGFGRRGELDALRNVTEISFQIKKPVKLIYTREDDMSYGYYRPYTFTKMKASFTNDLKEIYWKQSFASQSIAEEILPKMMDAMMPSWISGGMSRMALLFADGMTVKEGINPPYGLTGAQVNWQKTRTPVTTLFWRSVGHTQNGFFTESFIDEIAHKAGIDPMTFREKRLDKSNRLLKVLQKVKEMSGWDKKNGKNLGVASHFSFQSYAAAVIEVEMTKSGVKVKNVWCAIDCGKVINPDAVHAQLMGSVIFGLSAALFGKIEIKDGKAVQKNYDDYPLLTMEQTPNIFTEIVETNFNPTGCGEPGVPVIAPALCNAIYNASKKRVRHLPVSDHMKIY